MSIKESITKKLCSITSGIQFIAVVVGMLAVLYEFRVMFPEDRELRNVQLHSTLASLATADDIEDASIAIQKITALMHQRKVDMTGISIPGVVFHLAISEYGGVDWSNVNWSNTYMKGVNFACTDRMNEMIKNYDGNGETEKLKLCASLKNANFSGANLTRVEFSYTDLDDSEFILATLNQATIENSIFTNSDFSKAEMSGIKIKYSDFSGSDFGRSIRFDSRNVHQMNPAQLERVNFSSVKMPRARFNGTKIIDVDFSGDTDLVKAQFNCDTYRGEKICSTIRGACFDGADLTKAKLEHVSIKNTDFSGANLSDADFDDVMFENVIISDAQMNSIELDEDSRDNLDRGRVQKFADILPEIEIPCSDSWRQETMKWQEKFGLP